MSFILDALKKSERERARSEQPSTLELPRGKQRRVTPAWMIIVLVLLLVNCGLLLFMMLRKNNSAQTTAPVATETTTPTVATPPVVVSRNQPIRSLEEEAGIVAAPAEEDATEASAGDEELVLPVQGSTAPVGNPSRMVTTAMPTTGMPTMESLGGHTALGLPELKLDLHVYGTDAKERMVFINGKRYREGEVLAEGPTVQSINAQGAILAWRGQNFLLPR